MRRARVRLRSALLLGSTVCAAVGLTGCGLASSGHAGSGPSVTMPSSIGATDDGSVNGSVTSAPTTEPTSASPSSTAASPVTSPSTSRPASPTTPAGRILNFQGIHLLLPVEPTDLPGIPDALRSALAAGLKKRWDAYGDAPACQRGPVYVVNTVDTAGWASIDAWDDPGVSGPGCAGVGGGHTGFWAAVDGTWREVIATQELPACADLTRYHFPVAIAGDKCVTGGGSEVDYTG